MKFHLVLLVSLLLALYTNSATAQTSDSVGKKYYAYAHFYANDIDQYTEYISSIFCWTYNPPKNTPSYPSDYLTKWAIAKFKDELPKEKYKTTTCRFQIDTTAQFYSAAQILKVWTMETTECTAQSIQVVIVHFPECVDK
jgi:hypothetical protein